MDACGSVCYGRNEYHRGNYFRPAHFDRSVPFTAAHPLYLWILSIWIFGFGACYLSMAITQRHDRTFIAIGAVGKLSFFGLMAVYALMGEISGMAIGAAVGDLVFAMIFVYWLLTSGRPKGD
jgi:hypothetical protein